MTSVHTDGSASLGVAGCHGHGRRDPDAGTRPVYSCEAFVRAGYRQLEVASETDLWILLCKPPIGSAMIRQLTLVALLVHCACAAQYKVGSDLAGFVFRDYS